MFSVMESISQNLSSTLTSGSANVAEPTEQVAVAAQVPVVGLPPLPCLAKRRKPNVGGPRRSSPSWDHFIKLPNEPEPTAACKHCHKRYLCDPKTHGTSNLLAHSKVCFKNPQNDPTQTALMFMARVVL
jgi:hypothetical protein